MLARVRVLRWSLIALVLLLAINAGVQFATFKAAWKPGGDPTRAVDRVPFGGDFVFFWSAGRIVAAGDGDRLYDQDRQREEIVRSLDGTGSYLPFQYPAWFAVPYAAVARLPYFWAYGVTTAAMIGALAWAVALLRRVSPTARHGTGPVLLGLLAFAPVWAGLFQGQNLAVSLLCFAGALVALREGRDRTAGVWLGLLLFKPHLAVPLLVLLAWRGRWRTVVTAGLVGAALAAAGALAAGPRWPFDFLALLRDDDYLAIQRDCCAGLEASLPAIATMAPARLGPWPAIAAAAIGVAAVIATARAWRGVDPAGPAFPLQFGLAVATTLVVAPRALWYDVALLVIPVLALLDGPLDGHNAVRSPTARQRLRLAVLLAVGFVWEVGMHYGVQPTAALPVAIAFGCWFELAGRFRVPRTRPARLPRRTAGPFPSWPR